jgi:Icc-related predicted phosphoesterase
MKILTVSDLHQRKLLYEQLWERVDAYKPDLVCVAGDWLEAGDGADMTPYEAAVFFCEIAFHVPVVFSPGNHELFESELREFRRGWKNKIPLLVLDRTISRVGDLYVVGFPVFACDDWRDWLPYCLDGLPSRNSIWLMHEPPSRELAEEFFVCDDWRAAVEEYQPIIVISGHDHNAPLDAGVWKTKIGKTTCVNAGQRAHPPGTLCYATFEIEFRREFGVGCGPTPYLRELRRHG